ncbi:MAG: type II toxin-antitoxin system VapC family toxin [Thermoanaerobaculia bacterium]
MIFIDTGAFLARYLASDSLHQKALRAWKDLEKRKATVVTSHFVLDETLTLLARRADYRFAAERGRGLYESETLQILRADSAAEVRALSLFEKFADQKVSFTDCVSFALMSQRKIERAFTFDRHFILAGFEVWPR